MACSEFDGLSRRGALKALVGTGTLFATTSLTPLRFITSAQAADSLPFSFDILTERMRRLAAAPYAATEAAVPDVLKNLNYDQYRLIQPQSDRAVKLGSGSGYRLQPFHLGWLFHEPVSISETDGGTATSLPFSAADFEYRDPKLAKAIAAITMPGVAGFRLSYPMNSPDEFNEVVSFVGASYFRALGRNNVYGGSARGAILDSWVTGPEEFPRFSEFYVSHAEKGAPVTICASLESQSFTGAFRFVLHPGTAEQQDTAMDVTARLFFRTDIGELGIAPLTSMFLFAETNRGSFDDYRPQVHDSNGLMMRTAEGEVTWRALNNPASLGNSYFPANDVRAFGLMQRDRDFASFEDAGARYEQRPSILVEPVGDWGEGSVRLIEIPAKLETSDNIVAFFVPKKHYKAGDSAEYSYRLRWGDLMPNSAERAYVYETRAGEGGVSGVNNQDTLRKFVVDFAGGAFAGTSMPKQVDSVATVSSGRITNAIVSQLPEQGMMRLVIDAEIDSKDPVELRAYLVGGGRQLTETWLYQWRAA